MMKRWIYLLFCLLLTTSLWSQTASPTVEVSPTSKIKYPNAADVLNPTPPAIPKATKVVPATKTQSGSTAKNAPAPLVSTVGTASAVATIVTVPANAASGWVWLWRVQGTESEVRDWSAQVSPLASVKALSSTSWEVTVSAADWDPATSKIPQAQRAVLVRR